MPNNEKQMEAFLKSVENMYIILDLQGSHVDVIIDQLLAQMMPDTPDATVTKLKHSLFTHDRYYKVGIARLRVPANLNRNCMDCQFVLFVLNASLMLGRRNEFTTARIFATLLSDPFMRNQLKNVRSKEAFRQAFTEKAKEQMLHCESMKSAGSLLDSSKSMEKISCTFLKGVIGDLRRRLPHYWSDYKDGLCDRKSIGKTMSCTMFLYFICILPSIAFGVLNDHHTDGALTVEKVLFSQTFGGLVFALFGGTPQIVLVTTAPLAIYAELMFHLSKKYDLDFPAFYACVGLWNVVFLIIYSVFDLSLLMQYFTRSSEEIFAVFISIAYAVDAFKATSENFQKFYYAEPCKKTYNRTAKVHALTQPYRTGSTRHGTTAAETDWDSLEEAIVDLPVCQRDTGLLYILLMLGTVWVGLTLYNFTRTPYLTATKREMIADYSLPIAVSVMSCVGYLIFRDVHVTKSFKESSVSLFNVADLTSLPVGAVFGAMGLGFCLSLLFFMDQNISATMVNAPQNKMKKGTSFHWDLMVVALINLVPSIFTLPMVHASLPQSPLHVRALADVEERVMDGHVREIVVRVRETRVAALLSHLLIGASLAITSLLSLIPSAVLYGLFLYVAITPLYNNQMAQRLTLLFTEEAAYPPTYYIRRVPTKKVHLFTFLQLLQLLLLCGVGFSGVSFLEMLFPVLIFLLIPFRQYCLPLFMDDKYIKALDYSN
ncbi:solute carrier family 4 member 11-like [Babylonia areolata]|uniref:solute carrier family 4 member 11-like n=1 Tax=Babylonia areolata TaxID=304850 RepID=UPI003FD5FD1A